MTNLHVIFNDLRPSPEFSQLLYNEFYDVLDSGRFIGGDYVRAFEDAWAEYCDAKYCVGVGNGHDALALACKYFDVNERFSAERYYEEEYFGITHGALTPWKTCLPTWVAVENGGFTPVPSDDYPHVIAIAVHIYGKIALPSIPPGMPLIEDCAQAHGAEYNGKKAGSFGRVGAWSFYPTKNLGALGDAGAVTTDDYSIAEFVRDTKNYGRRNRHGINSRLDSMQAAFLLVKLPYLDTWNRMRTENAQAYLETINRDGVVVLPEVEEGHKPCWHQFAIETPRRDELRLFLSAHGVDTLVHYPEPPFRVNVVCPEAEQWAKRTLSLPVAPHARAEQCREIGKLINQWMEDKP